LLSVGLHVSTERASGVPNILHTVSSFCDIEEGKIMNILHLTIYIYIHICIIYI
jgi:hypothetical protein